MVKSSLSPNARRGPAASNGSNGRAADGSARLPARPVRRTPHGLRVAAIDIGSNSLHMVIVEVTDQLAFRILASEKELTQLGSAALIRHKLTRRAMVHTYEVLGRYQRIAHGFECDVILAYATSAVRECINGPDFVELLKLDLGLAIQVVNSQEEARLIYLAVRQAIDLGDDPALIVDIGGGSAEFIVATGTKALLLQSRKVGASRLAQQFIHSDPLRKKDLEELETHIDKTLRPILAQARSMGVKRIIGTSGTMENLVAMCLAQHGEETTRHRLLTEMTREDFNVIYRDLRRLPLKERRRLPGLDPGRADQIVAGAVLVDYLFKNLGDETVGDDARKETGGVIEVCDRAMREGMIIDYMQTHWPKVKLSVQVRDPRRRSIIELGRRCNFDEAHGNQVAALSLSLFDQLPELHGLSAEARELLEYAAIVHDIGWHISHSSHHKHSYYLIKNGDLEGFSPVEVELIANIARYHRRSAPKKSHEPYMALRPEERTLVCKLAAILRLADGMDRGHYGNVQRVRAIRSKGRVAVRLHTTSDPELEIWGVRHKTDLFAEVFHVRVGCTARQEPERGEPVSVPS